MPSSKPLFRMIDAELPDFGEPTVEPVIPAETYAQRVAEALRRAEASDLQALVVYGDREHTANVAYLTGYDPRFEEALVVLVPGRRPTLFVGNEGWGYAELAAGAFDRVLCQTFSLLGQPRDRQQSLDHLLRESGLRHGMRIGAVGWKSFGSGDPGATPEWLEIPSFIADALRALAGGVGRVTNATDLFMNPTDGMRSINEVDQLARFEFAATFASQALRNVLFGIRPGMTELDAGRLMAMNGLPLAAHTMLSSGPRAAYGLPSPSLRRLERGDPFTMACAPQGALNARAGFLVASADELPEGIRDYVDRLVAPVFRSDRGVVRDDRDRCHGGRPIRGDRARISATRSSASGSIPATSSISTNGCIRRSSPTVPSRCGLVWRSRWTSSRRRTRRGSRRTSRTASPLPMNRCAAAFATRIS